MVVKLAVKVRKVVDLVEVHNMEHHQLQLLVKEIVVVLAELIQVSGGLAVVAVQVVLVRTELLLLVVQVVLVQFG